MNILFNCINLFNIEQLYIFQIYLKIVANSFIYKIVPCHAEQSSFVRFY